MSEDQKLVLAEIKACISELPAEQRVLIEAEANVLRAVVKACGEENGRLAFALVGAEMASE